jgi:hypothetical protein
MKILVEWREGNILRGISLEAKLSDTVRSLKQQIMSKVAIPPSRQCLVFAGRQLEEARTLSDLVVHDAVVLVNSLVIIQRSSEDVAADINGRAGICVSLDPENRLCKVQIYADGALPKRQIDVRPEDLKVCGGSVHNPLFLFEDFEAQSGTNMHNVNGLIGPTKLLKNAHHVLDGGSASRQRAKPKSRVFSLQVECGTCTIWYSKNPEEVASFFSGPNPSELSTDLHHTMPLLGVIDLRFASMFHDESDPCSLWVPPAFPLTIDLRASSQLPNPKLSAKYFYCIKKFDALRLFFPSRQVRHSWIEKLQSCNVLLGICFTKFNHLQSHIFQGTVLATRVSQDLVKLTRKSGSHSKLLPYCRLCLTHRICPCIRVR